ncbi:hypothetical protein PPSIR1_31238 [Plesiocystis pacifica SIR-1]|uniref:SGNH/GDSL hydrolase family protein n=1 Tax=Plesiocystis pacifica SIR-1 TaxID=391625 RepID=A6GKJ9_9BACT|nr:hypothetical protein PPSIR1_31238 [Plesiocystis pacifica SIR-1]
MLLGACVAGSADDESDDPASTGSGTAIADTEASGEASSAGSSESAEADSTTDTEGSSGQDEASSESSEADSTTDAEGSESAGATTGGRELPRVLFIGNSYTFFNDLPALVANVTASVGQEWETGAQAIGGATVETHLFDPGTATLLAEGWDVVVLQGQSVEPIFQTLVFEAAVVDFAALVEAESPGAELLLFETWARGEGSEVLDQLMMTAEEMQQGLSEGYAGAAEAASAEVVPVGQAWALALGEVPPPMLHTGDLSHPNLTGSFLTACMFSIALTGEPATANAHVPDGLDAALADTMEIIADQI